MLQLGGDNASLYESWNYPFNDVPVSVTARMSAAIACIDNSVLGRRRVWIAASGWCADNGFARRLFRGSYPTKAENFL
jgi:hypothetical protein